MFGIMYTLHCVWFVLRGFVEQTDSGMLLLG